MFNEYSEYSNLGLDSTSVITRENSLWNYEKNMHVYDTNFFMNKFMNIKLIKTWIKASNFDSLTEFAKMKGNNE